VQNIVKLANVTNNQLANIKTTLLQTEKKYEIQIRGDIYSISEELKNIIHRNMKWQSHHIQVLLADVLDQCRGKENKWVDEHIKVLQEVYQKMYQATLQPMVVNKGKQKEEVI